MADTQIARDTWLPGGKTLRVGRSGGRGFQIATQSARISARGRSNRPVMGKSGVLRAGRR